MKFAEYSFKYDEILSLATNDKKRLFQCVTCRKNPEICGCTEKDEDVNGMCMKYKERMIKNEQISTKRNR